MDPATAPTTTPEPVAEALRAAWLGEDPGPTRMSHRPPERRRWPGPALELPRAPGSGPGPLLDLALATDPRRRTGGVRLRRVPSAGGRYPVEAHLLNAGTVWRYDALSHALHAPAASPYRGTAVVLSLVPSRTVWRYGPRSLPIVLLDLGHAVAALHAAARARGLRARTRLAPGADLARSARLPWHEGAVRWPGAAPEYPLAVVHLQAGAPRREDDAVWPPHAIGEAAPTPRAPAAGPAAEWRGQPPPEVSGAAAHLVEAALSSFSARTADSHADDPGRSLPMPGRGFPESTLLSRSTAAWERIVHRPPARSLPAWARPRRPSSSPTPCTDTRPEGQDPPPPRPGDPLQEAIAHLGADRVVYLRPDTHSGVLADLAPRSCGQPRVASADGLLLLLGSAEAGPHTLPEHVGAGAAAHAAWLAATLLRYPVRPVGCWTDTVLAVPGDRLRVLHALALGPPV